MDKNLQKYFEQRDIQESKVFAGLAYFILFFIIPAFTKNSKFGKFHANQAIVAYITGIVMWILHIVVDTLVLLSWSLILTIILYMLYIIEFALFIFVIINLVNAFCGKASRIPVIGRITIISGANDVETSGINNNNNFVRPIGGINEDITCPNCGAKVSKGKKFCANCGSKMPEEQKKEELKCNKCGSVIPAGTKFCPECGEKVVISEPKKETCPNCNANLPNNVKFCPECGYKVGE